MITLILPVFSCKHFDLRLCDFHDVTSDPFKCSPPVKLSLTCNCDQHGHTLSHADRGRNHGDRGQLPPHTDRLVTKNEAEYSFSK